MTKDTENMVIYQSDTGAISLRPDTSQETIWATQKQMAQLFNVNIPAITKHIDNIYQDEELDKNSTVCKMEVYANMSDYPEIPESWC